jgi:hypothetical protein
MTGREVWLGQKRFGLPRRFFYLRDLAWLGDLAGQEIWI